MKLTADQCAQFDREGYLFLSEYFNPGEARVLNAAAADVYAMERIKSTGIVTVA